MSDAAQNPQKVSVVAALRSKGFTVSLSGDGALRVGPKKKLTLPVREWIRKARPVLIEELLGEPLEDLPCVLELARHKFGTVEDPVTPPAPPGRDSLVRKEGAAPGWDKAAFYHHRLDCTCEACIFPEPKYARPFRPKNGGAA